MSPVSRPSLPPAPSQTQAAPARLVDATFARLLTIQVSIGFGYSLYLLLPKYLATELHAGASSIGAFTSCALLAAVVASPLLGRWLDQLGRRRCMQISGVTVLLASLGMILVRELGPVLYGLRVAQGIGFALGFNAAAANVADRAPPERLGKAMGLLGVASLGTNAIAPLLGEILADALGWSAVFAVAASTGVITWLLCIHQVDAPLAAAALPTGTSAVPVAHASKHRGVWVAGIFNGVAFGTLVTFGQAFALEQGALNVAGYYLGYTVGAMVVRLALGNAADRWGRRRIGQMALFGYGIVVFCSAYLRPSLLELFGLGFGICHGFLYPALAALVAGGAAPAKRGKDLTSFAAAFNGGAGIALFGGGWLARAYGYPFVFSLVGIATMASSVSLMPRLRRPLLRS